MTGPYDDLLDLPHPTSARHPRMPAIDRAAQFSPFAALTGYEAVIRETARLTDRRIELDEDAKSALDRKLRIAADRLDERPPVTITYFQADKTKPGGRCETIEGVIRRIDDYRRVIVLLDGRQIAIDDLVALEGALFGVLL